MKTQNVRTGREYLKGCELKCNLSLFPQKALSFKKDRGRKTFEREMKKNDFIKSTNCQGQGCKSWDLDYL